jgi:hypothetical protein
MNPNYGYQLYQAGRTMSRAEMLAGDDRRGRRAAATRRGAQSATRRVRAWAGAAFGGKATAPAHVAG